MHSPRLDAELLLAEVLGCDRTTLYVQHERTVIGPELDAYRELIRRRGENISSFEVESEVTAFEPVAEAAAIPVPSELGEDEVMVVVAPVAGKEIEPLELFRFLEPRMAHFMLPRFIRVVDELPKTPTQKVQKHLLKEAGITGATWDREAEGITVKREKIGG